MKRNIFVLLLMLTVVNVITLQSVFAEDVYNYAVSETKADDNTEAGELFTSDKIILNVHIEDAVNFLPSGMVFGIYSPEQQFWGARRILVSDTAADHTVVFDVPEYVLGEQLYLSLFSGAEQVQYGNDFYAVGDMIPVQTYTYISEDNQRIYGDDIYISVIPMSSKFVKANANGWELYFKNPAKIINGVCMIPMYEYLEALEMTECVQVDYRSGKIELNANGHSVLFFINGEDMYADDKVTYSDTVPMVINGVIYVPFRFLVEGLGGSMTAWYDGSGVLNISAALRLEVQDTSESIVNSRKITSKTDYLVWVSKKDFTVTVFLNKGGSWKEEKSFMCSIGAPSTPTITGEFEYYSREARWSYENYYVGPIMRFYKGYALHSTLIRYDGSDADARLGKMISHGCVRLAPKDIQWMVDMVPLHTKIYITD